MAININNDYPEFVITDTLHQLVNRLNQLTNHIDSNTRLFDSSVNTLLGIIDSSGKGMIKVDSDLLIQSLEGNINLDADSGINLTANDDIILNANDNIFLDAGDKILLDVDSGEILLRSQGTQFGALKKDPASNNLHVYTGLDLVVSFDATLNTTVAGSITMPSTGSTPNTNSKTVHGAINEVIQEHDSDHAVTEARLDALEPEVASLRTDLTAADTRVDLLDSYVTQQNLLNIADRLTTIEAQIVTINDRLNVLEIFT